MLPAPRSCLVALAATTAACSILYNPNNLREDAAPDTRATVDAEIILDTNPEALALDGVEPGVLEEGQGAGGSYATILVIHGMQLVANNTTVAITAHDGSGPIPGLVVDNAQLDISADGRDLAVPIAFAVDITRGATTPRVRVDVTVSQMGPTGLVIRTLAALPGDAAVLQLAYLDELTNASPELVAGAIAPGGYRYARVVVTGGLRPSTNAGPLRIAAVSSISITGITDVKAVLGTAHGGGNSGGNGGGASTLGPAISGGTGAGAGGGKSSGGGGGFGGAGAGGALGGAATGDDGLRDLATDRSSGGGGGAGGVGVGSFGGGVGGAGGGAIELTAGGDLAIGDLTAIGGDGTATAAAGNAGAGGGGSGGTVLLRARHVLSFTSVLASGGLAGVSGSVASFAGGDGRVRIDVPALAMDATPAAFRGPMLAAGSSLIVRTALPTLAVIGAKNRSFGYFFTNHAGAQAGTPHLIGPSGMQNLTLPVDQPLARGINHFCLLVDGATAASPPEAMNCFDLVYLYTP